MMVTAASTSQGGIAGERTILSSNNGLLTLTSVRVIFDAKTTGASKFLSIPLDAVASCGLVTRSQPLLLVVAAIAGLACLALSDAGATILALIVAFVFVGAYFATRKAVLKISPNGGEEIAVAARGMKRDEIIAFLVAVHEARITFIRTFPSSNAT
jgi:hypothetical protein